MSARLTPQRESEIRERAEAATPGPWWTEILPEHGGESIGIDAPGDNWIVPVQDLDEPNAEFMGHAREDVPALLAEIERQRAELAAVRAAVRAERDEVAVEVARFGIYGTATSAAKALVARASELVDENASLRAERDEARAGALHEAIEAARGELLADNTATDADTAYNQAIYDVITAIENTGDEESSDAPNDRRRRIYIDGKGNGWIDLNRDAATGEQNVTGLTDQWQIKSTDDVREATGSIREIGRCW